MQFIKLNKTFELGEFTETNLINAYAINGKGISLYNVDNYNKDLILSVIPERFRDDFFVREMKINYNIPPHTDSHVSATINFYVKAKDCKTNFYKNVDSEVGVKMTTQTTGRTFKEDDLELTGSFIAESNQAWLLDVSSPHSVKNIGSDTVDRIALVLQSYKYNFNQLYDMLQETGCIDLN